MRSGSSSTTPQMTAERTISLKGDTHETRVLFFHELNGGKGNGHVPVDPDARAKYLSSVQKYLRRRYDLDKFGLARLVALYGKVNGPCDVNRELRQMSSSELAGAVS